MDKHLLISCVAALFILCSLCALTIGCKPEPNVPEAGHTTMNGAGDPGSALSSDADTELPSRPAEAEGIPLVQNGVSSFQIVRSKGSQALVQAAETIQKKIRVLTGVELAIVNADQITADDYCIVVGASDNFPETQAILADSGYGIYGFYYQARRLMILGASDDLTEKALQKFITSLNSAVTKEKALMLDLAKTQSRFLHNNWLENVPHPEGDLFSITDCDDSTFMLLIRDASPETFRSYLKQLDQSEYIPVQENEINDNLFATYQNENGQITVSYIWNSHSMRVICQAFKNTAPIPSAVPETGYTKLTDTRLAVMSLNYSAAVSNLSDAGGLSLVITLEDGRYVIIDGGYSADATGLYNYLVDNNVRTAGVTIAAWILTHDHYDHRSAFQKFVSEYGSHVHCEYLISNALPSGFDITNETNPTVLFDMSRYSSQFADPAKVIKPHAGQKFYFCNVEFEMLYTHEELYPKRAAWLNEISLVFNIRVGGQKILVMGDAELQAIDTLMGMYGQTLKCDILQLPHHGYTAIAQSFFDNTAPNVVIWPSSRETVQLRNTSSWRGGIYKKLTDACDIYFVADGEVEILTLPYLFGVHYQTYKMDFQARS